MESEWAPVMACLILCKSIGQLPNELRGESRMALSKKADVVQLVDRWGIDRVMFTSSIMPPGKLLWELKSGIVLT